jgi:hypothetical protein
MLALLARSLPAPMARLSGDALALVNFATGNVARCSCCCDGDSEGEEVGGEPGSPCSDDRRPGGGGGAGPSQALLVPNAAAPADGTADGTADEDSPGPSSRPPDKPSGSQAAAAAAAAPRAALGGAGGAAGGTHARPGPRRFSKAALAAAGEGGAATAQHPLSLAFRSPLVEGEYREWAAHYHRKARTPSSLLALLRAGQPRVLLPRSIFRTCAPSPPPHPTTPHTHTRTLVHPCRQTSSSPCCWSWPSSSSAACG